MTGPLLYPVIADQLFRRSVTRDAVLILAAVGITALSARAEIPWYPVPFTLQTLAVTLSGLALGARRGLLAQLAYVGLGAAGLPLLAGGGSGVHHLWGPTAGYLVSFPIVAYALGFAAERGWTKSVGPLALVLVAGHTFNLALGGLWLEVTKPGIGWSAGVAPFIVGGLFKSVAAAAVLPELDRRIRS